MFKRKNRVLPPIKLFILGRHCRNRVANLEIGDTHKSRKTGLAVAFEDAGFTRAMVGDEVDISVTIYVFDMTVVHHRRLVRTKSKCGYLHIGNTE